MYEYQVTIKNNNKIICTVGANSIDYDNILWWQLAKLVRTVKKGFSSKEELLNKIENETEYFHRTRSNSKSNITIDLDKNTMNKPYFPLYQPEEVCPEVCCISLKTKNGKYYAVYEDECENEMPNVSFNKVNLLNKPVVTLDEFLTISEFVDSLVYTGENTDYVLNNELIIRFNAA